MKLYVGNIPGNLTENDLQGAFGAFGAVREVAFVLDRATSQPQNFGFITMNDPAEAQAAIAGMHGRELSGRTLMVSEARLPGERPGRWAETADDSSAALATR